ncbi:uncharacterized protein MONOS_7453 [Monocercomonoides exilis]|uniref:uncharacterized protein n=1 Tax=Monocercomonoides exilis TaxID=2049356 RepID=UPI003559B9A0|nr:hypothetical protein MONOS_7453 [Monocercomonoides exilis]|eukprot:MONOS_7453.1-p1 / transcript=MONOS_7453.1 / gene=MONOS_7453 / organism=Monocercomonoides_exilis_PA203 / gene_product=unspecified product / transcript_product=unspecified product / location=Mono_scaffold00255:21679-22055(+) / protein_length=67 / sequence_SO=supercontig / SO=protein_coding / is_pseudo=false
MNHKHDDLEAFQKANLHLRFSLEIQGSSLFAMRTSRVTEHFQKKTHLRFANTNEKQIRPMPFDEVS